MLKLNAIEETFITHIMAHEDQTAYAIGKALGLEAMRTRRVLLALERKGVLCEDPGMNTKLQQARGWLIHPTYRAALNLDPLDLKARWTLALELADGSVGERRAMIKREWHAQRDGKRALTVDQRLALPVCEFCGVRHCSRKPRRIRKKK